MGRKPGEMPQKIDTPWLPIAQLEMHSVGGATGQIDNSRIAEYHRTTTLRTSSAETPWCSSFVNWCIEQSGIAGTKSALARSWLNWGTGLDQPTKGCVVVLRRGDDSSKGHVGFFWAKQNKQVLILGGNQDGSVTIKTYPQEDVLGYRWPSA